MSKPPASSADANASAARAEKATLQKSVDPTLASHRARAAGPAPEPAGVRGPLAGVTVVDLTRVLAGPYCTMVLSDLGARVIKIEQPGTGDDARAFGPFIEGTSAYFASLNRGKESIALDLKAPADKVVFEKLLERADVVIENFRPGTMEKLGYGFEDLKARYPKLIYAAASGFGHTGPYSKRAAYDMVVQAMGGLMSITGTEGGPPVRVGTSIGDITAGLFTAIGITTALLHRNATGEAMKVDVAMLDCQVAILENAIARYAATGEVAGPLGGRHPSITPFAAFQAKDGHVIIAAGNDALFVKMCDTLGLPKLPADPRYKTNALRTENWKPLFAAIEGALAAKPVAEWLTALDAAGVPAGPINTVDKVVADPHVKSRNMLVTATANGAKPLMMAGNPIKLSHFDDAATRRPAPKLDADRAALLAEITGASATPAAASTGTDMVPVSGNLDFLNALALTRQSPQRLFDYLRGVIVGDAPGSGVSVAKDASFIERAEALADALMSQRGEVSGTVIANDLVRLVRGASGAERFEFFRLLARRYNPDPARIRAATDLWHAEPNATNLANLSAAVESPRQELFRRMNMAPDGTATLVKLREQLGPQLKSYPDLAPIDADLKHLLGSWFNRGFLELQRISWHTPAATLEKLIQYEAVHAIDGWDDLRRRLASDRRCFGFFHPSLPDEPLIFVEVALVNEMSGRIAPIIRAPLPGEGAPEPDTAIFYSISNCQPGLRGISFGNFLIKQVAADLAKELPGLRTFATLSPMPGFRRWVEAADTDLMGHLPRALVERVFKEGAANGAVSDLREAVRRIATLDAGISSASGQLARETLLRLGARYLAGHGQKRGISDPVARFHLGNGARIERVNFMADTSEKGMRESYGVMVNYLYDLKTVERNHEAFANGRPGAMSADVTALTANPDQEMTASLKKRVDAALDIFGTRKG
jgi:CoA:oxalate CoA-transferase